MNILEVKEIAKTYGQDENLVYALGDISFKMEQGECVAVVGRSGSGKSTLLNLIGGLDKPTRGEILVRGHNIARLNRKELTIFRRRNIGFIFQDYSLMPILNVYDNIALPVTFDKGKNIEHEFIEELIKELGLEGKQNKFPRELSGGEQQRVAIARALVNKPAIILADEPTGNLDSLTTNDVMGIFWRSCRKYHQTVLMVTHNEEIAQTCDRVIQIEDGKMVGGESE